MEEGVDVEAFYVCDICRKFASPSQMCQGVHQDSQICDENHIFVTSLARFFCDGLREFFVFATHKISLEIAPLSKYHLEAAARRELVGISLLHQISSLRQF